MTCRELETRALSLPGVEALNAMQQAMLQQTKAPLTVLEAPTGTGKTLAFCLRMLQYIETGAKKPQAVVLAPSRELVLQVAEVVRKLASGCKTVAFYGGHSMAEEAQSLQGSVPDIIVATPGRLLDHVQRRQADLAPTATLVLDEYDKMLELGFEGEMKRLMTAMRRVDHVILTSATHLDPLPTWLPVKTDKAEVLTFKGPERKAVPIVAVDSPSRDKLDTLADLLRALPTDAKAIVFTNHRESAERVHNFLRREHISAGIYHGGLEQLGREDAVELLANGSLPVLVATDLAARGLDIPAVDAVVHYHLPTSKEAWTHRNGRTARQQADGTVYVILAPEGEDLPEYIRLDRRFNPDGHGEGPQPQAATLHLNLGRKDKISRGDVVGYLTSSGLVNGADIGRITLRDHAVLVAVPRDRAGQLIAALAQAKIKGKRVRLTRKS